MSQQLQRDKPAYYQIQVQGGLSPRWADYLGGLEISITDQQDSSSTTLAGEIKDQAELLGILNSLYNLGFPLLTVEYGEDSRELS